MIWLGLVFISYLPTLFIPFLHIDEGGWAVVSQEAFTGNLYQRLTDHKPPFLFQFHYLASLGEHSILCLRLVTIVLDGLAAYYFFFILRRFIAEDRARVASIFFAILVGLINYGGLSMERIYLAFCIFAAASALKVCEAKTLFRALQWAALTGLFLGAATSLKQTAVFLGLISVAFLCLGHYRSLKVLVAFVSALVFTAITWKLSGVNFPTIWQEGYLANFDYMSFESASSAGEILKNAVYILWVQYAPVTLGSLLSIGIIVSRKTERVALWKPENRGWTALTLLFILSSYYSVALGKRFYQQYYTAALPCLCFLTVLRLSERALGRTLIFCMAIVFSYHTYTTWMQISNHNKHLDSEIKHLVKDIDLDTRAEDTIWISQGILPVYYLSHREPAVRNVYFSNVFGRIDVCRAEAGRVREDASLPIYQEFLNELKTRKPKVIFWTQRHSNSCSDRLKLENFPSLLKILESSYHRKWQTPLGIYFRLTST